MSSKKKPDHGVSKASLIRSSAAEYLTFVAARGQRNVEAVYADENVWLTRFSRLTTLTTRACQPVYKRRCSGR